MSFESLTRNVHAILSFYNEKSELVDISRAVESIEVKQVTCSDDILKMGEFCKNSLEFTYRTEFIDTPIAWNNKRVKLSFTEGKTEEEQEANKVDVGIFYVTTKNVETSNNGRSYKVTAYDLPDVMSEQFDTTACTSTSVSDIVSYICKISGMSFVSGTTFSLKTITSIEDKITNVGMLAYIVGYDGKNIRTTADGKLETYWYYSNGDSTHFKGTITRSSQFLDEFTCKDNSSELNAITCGYGSGDDVVTYSVGSGVALTYTNPYMTQAKLQTILNRVKGFDYNTGTIKFTGNPNYRCGDVVQAETSKGTYVLFPIMEQTISFDGGLKSTITSYTYETENTVMGSSSPTDKKISQAYNGLTKEFQRQTGIVNNNLKGGYYRLLQDEDTKYPYGWQIADSEEITSTTKGWQWTQGGLIYSQDGFKTASNVAITMDGAISANFITTGTLKAIDIEGVNIKGSTIKFGTDAPITASGRSNGVQFIGDGIFLLQSVKGFSLTNFKDSERETKLNSLYTYTTSNVNGTYLYNYKLNTENKLANQLYLLDDGKSSTFSVTNYFQDDDKISNISHMKGSSSDSQYYVANYYWNGKVGNEFSMTTTDSDYANIVLTNMKPDGTIAGQIVFWSDQEDDSAATMYLRGGNTNGDMYLGMSQKRAMLRYSTYNDRFEINPDSIFMCHGDYYLTLSGDLPLALTVSNDTRLACNTSGVIYAYNGYTYGRVINTLVYSGDTEHSITLGWTADKRLCLYVDGNYKGAISYS